MAKLIKNGVEIFSNVLLAKNCIARMIGLLGKQKIVGFDALFLSPCSQIHSWGMKFNFDAIYLDKNFQIIALYENIEKNKVMPYNINARHVVEGSCGDIAKHNLKLGDTLELVQE